MNVEIPNEIYAVEEPTAHLEKIPLEARSLTIAAIGLHSPGPFFDCVKEVNSATGRLYRGQIFLSKEVTPSRP
jgi:hypothetical protein